MLFYPFKENREKKQAMRRNKREKEKPL